MCKPDGKVQHDTMVYQCGSNIYGSTVSVNDGKVIEHLLQVIDSQNQTISRLVDLLARCTDARIEVIQTAIKAKQI